MTTIDQPADGPFASGHSESPVAAEGDMDRGDAVVGGSSSAGAETSESEPSAIQRIAVEVASLAGLAELPLAEHADAYQRVHVELQRALAEIDGA